MSAAFQPGDRVRFSPLGQAKVRSMPEAWGLHTAHSRGEIGEVIDVDLPEGEGPAQVSVEFPSGGAYFWDVECFERAETLQRDEG